MNSTQLFQGARDLLLDRREDYDHAYREFRWPQLEEFNWASDFFDVQAQENDTPALWILEEDGRETQLSYATVGAL